MNAERFRSLTDPTTPDGITRVLIVDDDPAARIFMEVMLRKRGFHVLTAESVGDAQAKLQAAGVQLFDCIVSDHLMPGRTSLDLMHWLREFDSCLATIVVTAEGEKETVAKSLRAGACDFLDKPLEARDLYAAVDRAVKLTRDRRALSASAAAVRDVGRTQHSILTAHGHQDERLIDLVSFPKSEAGGDFLNRFCLGPNRHLVLLSDVSGHDLKAAFVSAYFQGIVRGMMEGNHPIPYIFEFFNNFLVNELNSEGERSMRQPTPISVAATYVMVDWEAGTATVSTSGSPMPVHVTAEGRAEVVQNASGPPLGWFADNPVQSTTVPIEEGGSVLMWTDGLESLADARQVSPVTMATALLLAQKGLRPPEDLRGAADDILVARVATSAERDISQGYLPILVEEYHHDQLAQINQLQEQWRRNLLACLPELASERIYDVLLASREIVINALKHGCGAKPDDRAQFQIAYHPGRRELRVFVNDPGPGHHFDVARHEAEAEEKFLEMHRGLILASHLAARSFSQRNGASLTLDFLT